MAEENVPTLTRTDNQLVPVKARLPIGKSNLLIDLQKMQKNSIFPVLEHGFQLDELWFTLDADLLCIALGITPKDSAHPFVAPPAGDMVIDFANNLGYPEELQFVSKMYVNSIHQPWRTILSMINQCLTGNTSGSDRPRHPVLQILWGVVSGTNIEYAELIWEEFVQAIKTFFSDATNLKVPTKKPKPHVIPYCRFTKLIIYYLRGRHNIHKRLQSPLHIMVDDYSLGNLKFVPKGELDEKYLEITARKPRQVTSVTYEEGGKKKKVPPGGKSKQPTRAKQPALAKQTKPVKEKTSKSSPLKKIRKGKVMKVHKGKRSDHLVDEEDEEPQPAFEPQVEDDEYNLQRGIQMSLEYFQAPVGGVAIREPDSGIIQKLPEVEGKGKGIISDKKAAQSLLDLQNQRRKDDTSTNVVRDTPSPADAKTGVDTKKYTSKANTEIFNDDEEHGEEVSHTVDLEERNVELDEA
ncbi:hypothetical protein Tco_1229895 [Tanacetum coccineum]